MSIAMMNRVWRELPGKVNAGQLLVALAMADHADDQGVCWPHVTTVARKCGMSGRTVQRHQQDLVAAGHLAVRIKAGPKQANHYILFPVTTTECGGGDKMSPPGNGPVVTNQASGGDTPVTTGGDNPGAHSLWNRQTNRQEPFPPNPPATRVGSGGDAATTATDTATAGQGQDARATVEAGGEHPDGPVAEHLERLVESVTGAPADRRWQRAVRRALKLPRGDLALGRVCPGAVARAWARRDRKRFSLATVLEAVAELTAQRREAERRAAEADRRRAELDAVNARREAQRRACLEWFRRDLDEAAQRPYLADAEERLRQLRRGEDPPRDVVESLAASDAARDLDWHWDPALAGEGVTA